MKKIYGPTNSICNMFGNEVIDFVPGNNFSKGINVYFFSRRCNLGQAMIAMIIIDTYYDAGLKPNRFLFTPKL